MPTLKLDGDASGAVKATGDVTRAAQQLNDGFKQVGMTSDQLRQKLQDAYNENPIDTYIRKCDELAQKLAAGKINAHQYKEQTDRLADGLKGVGEAHEHSFGREAVSELTAYAAGIFGAEKALESMTEALDRQAEAKRRAAEDVSHGLPGAGGIANASNSQADFDKSVEFANELMKEGIVSIHSQDSAMRQGAGVQAAGASESDKEFLIRAAHQKRIGSDRIGEFAGNVARVQQAYDGQAGSFEQISKQFLVAGADTLGISSPEDIGRQLGDLADAARENGIPFDQVLATYTTVAREKKSARSGLKAARDLIEGKGDGLTGKGAAQYAVELQKIQGAGSSEMKDYIGGNVHMDAARSSEEATAAKEYALSSYTSDRTNVWNTLLEQRRKNIHDKYGYGVMGTVREGIFNKVASNYERFDNEEAMLRQYGGLTDEQGAAAGVSSKELTDIRALLQRQTEIMEKDHGSPPAPHGKQE